MFEAILQFHIPHDKFSKTESLRKRAKSCENMCFTIDTLKKELFYNLAKTLRKAWTFATFRKFLNISTTLCGGEFPPTNTVEIREMWCISSYFREKVLALFCCQNPRYFADIIRTFPWCSQLLAIPVFANLGNVHLDAPRRQWAGDEALGVQHLQRRAKWPGARTGSLSTACHDFSAGEHNTLSWTQNYSGNLHARIYTP